MQLTSLVHTGSSGEGVKGVVIMMNRIKLRMSGRQHTALLQHLFPGDNKEAVALALCGMGEGSPVVEQLHRLGVGEPFHLL